MSLLLAQHLGYLYRNRFSHKSYHYLKHNKVNRLPARLMFIDTETKVIEETKEYQHHVFRLGVINYLEQSNYDIKQDTWREFYDVEKLNEYIESKAYFNSTLYIFASNPNFDISIIGFERYFRVRGWCLRFLRVKGMVYILVIRQLKYCKLHRHKLSQKLAGGCNKCKRRTIKVLALQNFLPTSIEKLGELLSLPKGKVDYSNVSDSELMNYCKQDVKILRDGILKYFEFCTKNDLGGFSVTKSGQALKAYRHKFMSHKILVHKNPEVLALERVSYFGGRVECFKIGKFVNSTYYKLDVNSMFPYVMRNYDYPIELITLRKYVTVEGLAKWIKNYCLIAKVEIDTDEPCYPYRDKNKVIFPVGKFVTCLCSEGIRYALKHRHITKVFQCALYLKARIFVKFVDYFYSLRLRYKREKNEIFANLCKLILNSLYGKMAQKQPIEITLKIKTKEDYSIEQDYNADTKQKRTVVTFFNRTIMIVGENESRDSLPSIASHVTEYARFYLLNIIKQAGKENVYYSDTDSVIVNEKGYDALRHLISNRQLGGLKIEKESDYLDIRGLKDYSIADETKIKGVNKNSEKIEDNKYIVTVFPTFRTTLKENLKEGYKVKKVEKILTRKYSKGKIDVLGNVSPITF